MYLRYWLRFPLAVLATALISVPIGYFFVGLSIGFIDLFEYEYASEILVALFFITASFLTYYFTIDEIRRRAEIAEKRSKMWKKAVVEQSFGYPALMKAIEEYEKFYDDELSNELATKKRPALKAAETVRKVTKERREAQYNLRKTKALIGYYESIAPFLLDFKEEYAESGEDQNILSEYTEEEKADPVSKFLTKQEYRKLSTTEKNQLALDRFWTRNQSKRIIGRLYERYVGYLYEQEGYEVDYTGIYQGLEDLGRDLICKKGKEILVIQCKNWSKFSTIYEKHIFQFFGTVFQYKDENPKKTVRGIFCTTTKVSDLARRFAEELGIELIENHHFDKNYPCIKCNINPSTKDKIYHLPFDQMYDKTKIDRKGEFYCKTVEEAEKNGFRRAFRWKGTKNA